MAAATTNSHGVTGSVAAMIDSAWSSDKNSDSESDSSPNQSAIGGAAGPRPSPSRTKTPVVRLRLATLSWIDLDRHGDSYRHCDLPHGHSPGRAVPVRPAARRRLQLPVSEAVTRMTRMTRTRTSACDGPVMGPG